MSKRPAKPKSRRIAASADDQVAPLLRVGFLLTPRFTLTAFAGFVDAAVGCGRRGPQPAKTMSLGHPRRRGNGLPIQLRRECRRHGADGIAGVL